MGPPFSPRDYVFGGYVVTQPVKRPESMSSALLPERVLTVSPCIAPSVPGAWSLAFTNVPEEERRKTAQALGIAPADLPRLIDHVTRGLNDGSLGWPNVVKSSDAVADLLRLLPRSRDWTVLGLALPRKHVASFRVGNAPPEGQGGSGVYETIVEDSEPPPAGVPLGFEPLGFEWSGQAHSWLCNQLETECFRALGIRPAESGLLGTEDDAERVTTHISRPDVGAEPVQWLPWLLVDYTTTVTRDGWAPTNGIQHVLPPA